MAALIPIPWPLWLLAEGLPRAFMWAARAFDASSFDAIRPGGLFSHGLEMVMMVAGLNRLHPGRLNRTLPC